MIIHSSVNIEQLIEIFFYVSISLIHCFSSLWYILERLLVFLDSWDISTVRSKEKTHRLSRSLRDCLAVNQTLQCIELQGILLRESDASELSKVCPYNIMWQVFDRMCTLVRQSAIKNFLSLGPLYFEGLHRLYWVCDDSFFSDFWWIIMKFWIIYM
jgi:hypothetical protein